MADTIKPMSSTDRLYPVARGPRQRQALAIVDGLPGLSVQALAQAMGTTPSRAEAWVRALEEAGAVRRAPAREG